MTIDQQLQALLDYQGSKVLSAYVDTDLTQKSKEAVRLMFRRQAAAFEEVAAEEIEAVQRFLEFEYDWQSRGVAVFAAGDDLWEVIPLPIAVPTQVAYADRPNVRPLMDIKDRLGEYAVAVLDRTRLRLFSVAWGQIQAETEAFGEALKRHKQGGWSAANYQRHEDNIALRNLKQGIEMIEAFVSRTGHRRLMLGGSSEVLAQVKEMMPTPLQEMLIGEFVVDVEAPPKEVLARSLDVAQEFDRKEERRLVEEAVTEAAKGGNGITGLADVLYALHQGRVRTLLVDETFHAEGWVCGDCGILLPEAQPNCPLCGGSNLEHVDEVVNLAIHKAFETGAEVNIVRENPNLLAVGGIAALTRY